MPSESASCRAGQSIVRTYCSPTKTPRDAGMDPLNAFAERSNSLQPAAHSEAKHIHTATDLGNGYTDTKQQQQQQQQHSRQSGQLARAIRDRACEVVRPEVQGPVHHKLMSKRVTNGRKHAHGSLQNILSYRSAVSVSTDSGSVPCKSLPSNASTLHTTHRRSKHDVTL